MFTVRVVDLNNEEKVLEEYEVLTPLSAIVAMQHEWQKSKETKGRFAELHFKTMLIAHLWKDNDEIKIVFNEISNHWFLRALFTPPTEEEAKMSNLISSSVVNLLEAPEALEYGQFIEKSKDRDNEIVIYDTDENNEDDRGRFWPATAIHIFTQTIKGESQTIK